MARIERRAILDRLQELVRSRRPIVGGGAGTGLSAKCEEAGGIDLIIVYNSGRYRMAGRASSAGLLAYGNANDIVLGGTGTIGYADESQVGDLSVVSVKVGDEYVAPSAEGAALVVESSPAAEGRADVDMAVDIDRTTTEAGAYPLVLASYLIACQHYDDQGTADLVKGYLSYVLSDDGQSTAAENAGSAPLDPAVQDEAVAIVEKITKK